jgi:hypothetical protein
MFSSVKKSHMKKDKTVITVQVKVDAPIEKA